MDLFSTNRLVAVVEDLRAREGLVSFLSLFFPSLIEETSEEIHFDTEDKPRRISPFVSPLVEGKIVESMGFATSTFKPAYVKDKRRFDANRPLKRMMGESLTGSLSPEQRIARLISMDLMDQIGMLRRRKEVMASQALLSGSVTVVGDGFPLQVVDFGRDAGLTIDLSGGAAEWDDAGISPIDDIEDWAALMQDTGGAAPTDVAFSLTAWRLFKADPQFDKIVDTRRAREANAIDLAPRIAKGLVLRGELGTMRLWTYTDTYIDNAGGTQKFLPDDYVVLGSGAIEGVQAHGAIRDEEAGYQAMEFFPKSWVEKDPSARLLMLQSAPLVVPFRPNCSMSVRVT